MRLLYILSISFSFLFAFSYPNFASAQVSASCQYDHTFKHYRQFTANVSKSTHENVPLAISDLRAFSKRYFGHVYNTDAEPMSRRSMSRRSITRGRSSQTEASSITSAPTAYEQELRALVDKYHGALLSFNSEFRGNFSEGLDPSEKLEELSTIGYFLNYFADYCYEFETNDMSYSEHFPQYITDKITLSSNLIYQDLESEISRHQAVIYPLIEEQIDAMNSEEDIMGLENTYRYFVETSAAFKSSATYKKLMQRRTEIIEKSKYEDEKAEEERQLRQSEVWKDCDTSFKYGTISNDSIFCNSSPSNEEQAFLYGASNWYSENCNIPAHINTDPAWVSFKTSSTLTAVTGTAYSGGSSGGSQPAKVTNMLAGKTYAETLGCANSGPFMKSTVSYLNKLKNSGGESKFVSGCVDYYDGQYSKQQCSCIREVGITVYPALSGEKVVFSSDIPRQIVQANPFVGMQLIAQCGVSSY